MSIALACTDGAGVQARRKPLKLGRLKHASRCGH
jgi:hypothetical protein